MSLKRCSNGHFYDTSKHSSCPHCGVNVDLNVVTSGAKFNTPVTRPLTEPQKSESVTMAKINAVAENKTVGLFNKKIGVDPIVAWFVCIEGVDKGRDYRIKSGRNFIGRSQSMDICISGDKSISRDKHAIIVYDSKKNTFIVQPGESREIFYLNDESVYVVMAIKAYDILELGETKLMFIPFCGEVFKWD